MINTLLWMVVGALSGWIGYLATRTTERGHVVPYLAVGMTGGLVGGVFSRLLGLGENVSTLDSSSILNALIFSAIFMTIYAALLNFFGNASHS